MKKKISNLPFWLLMAGLFTLYAHAVLTNDRKFEPVEHRFVKESRIVKPSRL